jgi:Sulfatase
VAAVAAGVTLAAALLSRRARGPLWQRLGLAVVGLPGFVALAVLTVVAQEVKAERGAFPTLHEVLQSGANASFLEGTVGFFRYQRMWAPALLCTGSALLVLGLGVRAALARRAPSLASPALPWAAGLVAALALCGAALRLGVAAQGRLSPRLAPAALGDPLSALGETAVDLALGRTPPSPAELLLQLEPTADQVALGAARLGWPARPGRPCRPHRYARPLDRAGEPPAAAQALLSALERVSGALFLDDDARVAVLQLSLESFRGDDLHALNPAAPRSLAPFTNGLYEAARAGGGGVLASGSTWQTGVRTAQGLAAMTCGLGTLPYNLSLIRDLDAFPLRCATDLLAEAGFRGTFFYGSDPAYDGMARFLEAHGVAEVVAQAQLPPTLPTGAWGGVTDLALFEAAVDRLAAGLAEGTPRFAMVMSLSNHSPFTAPADLPDAVRGRVEQALAERPNRALADDRRRLLTYAYTDAALEHLLQRLEARGVAERTVVVLAADHSTGDDFVWGDPTFDHETDAAKARIPFAVVIPPAFLARARDPAALRVALDDAQARLDELPLSQNDVPALLLALLSAHPGLKGLPVEARWHTLGGQATGPAFRPGGEAGSFLLGINGVDELYALDRQGRRLGAYEDVVFLGTRAVREEVTPRLIPVAATLVDTLRRPWRCAPEP